MKPSLLFVILICSLPVAAQWYEQSSGTTADIVSVDFVNGNAGWISGTSGLIKGTTDGGLNWENTSTHHASGQACVFYTISFPTIDEGIALGYIRVNDNNMRNWARTTNSGQTWDYPTTWTFPAGVFYASFFLNDSIGWHVNSHGQIGRSNTGVWGFSSIANLSASLRSIYFINENAGWVSGKSGFLAKSIDGGDNWEEIESDLSGYLRSVFFTNLTTGYLAGDNNSDTGYIFKTNDGGESWYAVNHPPLLSAYRIQFVNDSIGWACGSLVENSEERGAILFTDDGGENWTAQYVCDEISILFSLFFKDEYTGWAVGSDGIIVKTTNAGGTHFEGVEENSFAYSVAKYPNPFTLSIIFEYELKQPEKVSLTIFDNSGKQINFIQKDQFGGIQQIKWHAEIRPAGIYHYRIQAGEKAASGKILKIK
jgi:photosystem II stability/assembly factor-like uncharacterized protein